MPEGPPPVLQAEELLRTLAAHEVEFVIIGGFALSAHGVVRGTKDIDVVPAPSSQNRERLARALRALEAEVMLADDFDPSELGIAPDEEGLSLGGNWVLRTTLGRLDVMQDVPGVKDYAQLHAGSIVVDVPGAGALRFCGLDDLVAMKATAGRPQDKVDIASLERARRAQGD